LEKLKAQPIAGEPQEIGESTSPGL